ncbi:adhesion G-protein coupled receptor D1-like [Pocillopora damicornis]|uniref:adhesion G-protein coupled receptor D1-like n=1 Tax=Pocillopora damicornis TaxID=46731 RepID=UPI000F557188|nr:adhesion G-protein coupled receptor D1-like [Pocillopora damicornis]
MYWERTALNEIVVRNCSEVDPELGGYSTSRCSSQNGRMTTWSFKESCFCEKKSLRQEFRHKLSIMNLTNILELTRGFVNKATNFTNKELFFNYLSLWFKSGALLLNPVNHSNDMVALNFSQAMFQTTQTENVFKPQSDSFCPKKVTYWQRWSLMQDIKEFNCGASNLTHTFRFCFTPIPMEYVFPLPFIGGNLSPESPPITIHWLRSVLKLRIDPNQLSLGSDTVSSLSLPPGNITSEMNFSRVLVPLQRFNCAWIEYDVNGTLKITAREVRDEEKERKAMAKIHLDLILSGISTVVVVICLILLSCLRIRNSERIFVHKNLLISICLVYIVMILDSWIFTNRKQTPKLCSAIAVLQHITHTAIFTWMLVEGIHLYIKLVKVFSVHKLYITYVVIGWGLPVVIVGLIAAIRPVTYDMSKTYYKDVLCGSLKLSAEIIRDRCWLNDGEWLHKGPILAILVFNLVIFVILLRVIFTKISDKYQTDNVEKTRKGLRSIAALLPLLGVTWLLGFFIHWSEVLAYLFIILNSTQGLVFCIFHGFLDDQVRESLLRFIRRTRLGILTQICRSIVSTTTQLSPAGSINDQANTGQRPGIAEMKHLDTKL